MVSTEPIHEKEPLLSQSDYSTEHDHNEDGARHDKVPELGQDDPPPDPRFNPPTPSPFMRTALILLIIFLFWTAFNMRTSFWKNNRETKVVYASRYSKEHKFRPAASPIVTETLTDGCVRIRGAAPTATPVQTPTPILNKKLNRKKSRKGKVLGKKDRGAKERK